MLVAAASPGVHLPAGISPDPVMHARQLLQSKVDDCLARLHLVRVNSSSQLLATLLALPKLLATCKV